MTVQESENVRAVLEQAQNAVHQLRAFQEAMEYFAVCGQLGDCVRATCDRASKRAHEVRVALEQAMSRCSGSL